MTETQEYALKCLRNNKADGLSPNVLATLLMAKRRTYQAASRRRFGYTSVAYKTLRRFVDDGLAVVKHSFTVSGYRIEHFYAIEYKPEETK